MNWLEALQQEIDGKKAELAKMTEVVKQIRSLQDEIQKLEQVKDAYNTVPKAKKSLATKMEEGMKRKGRVWTEEQKAAASAKRKATLAAKAQ